MAAQKGEQLDAVSLEPHDLNASPNPRHLSYRILGILAWSLIILALVGLVLAPRSLLEVARFLAVYMMIRLVLLTVFYLYGLVQFRAAEERASAAAGPAAQHQAVHHVVVLPNFDEPPEILSRTLQALTVQQGARDHMTVVLGMEEREPGARDKAEALVAEHRGAFHSLMATYHPSALPGEIPGKGTNQTWAVRCARRELVDRLGIAPDQIVVTIADCDSIIHPLYFAELTRQFGSDLRRHSLVWQPPILFENDIWRAHALIRLVTFYTNVAATGDYTNPWEPKFPYSTYSMSLKLLEEVGYWDPTVVTEDVNIFMRSFFKKAGRAFVQRVYLPVRGNPTHGANLRHALGILFAQKVRHGRGGAEIGYLLQKWNSSPGTPFVPKLWRLLKLLHDHLLISTAGIIVTLGIGVSIALDQSAAITFPPAGGGTLAILALNLLGGGALVTIWLAERLRLSRGRTDWRPRILLGEFVPWLLFPVLFFALLSLPILQAQTTMLLGKPSYFNRTPKGLQAQVHD